MSDGGSRLREIAERLRAITAELEGERRRQRSSVSRK